MKVGSVEIDEMRAPLRRLSGADFVVRDIARDRLEKSPFRIAAIFVERLIKADKRVLCQLLGILLGETKRLDVKTNEPPVILLVQRLESFVVAHQPISSP